jgi:hypothetical protein
MTIEDGECKYSLEEHKAVVINSPVADPLVDKSTGG